MVSEHKGELLRLLESWLIVYKKKRVSRYYKQIKMFLVSCRYDLYKVDRRFFYNIWKRKKWAERYIYPLSSWNSYCKYGREQNREIFPDSCIMKKQKRLPERLKKSRAKRNALKNYSQKELSQLWGIVKSQVAVRARYLAAAGYIHIRFDERGQIIILKKEIDKFEGMFVSLAYAAVVAGGSLKNENFKKLLRKHIRDHKISAIKIGNLHFLNRQSFEGWLYRRNLK